MREDPTLQGQTNVLALKNERLRGQIPITLKNELRVLLII